MKRALSFLFFSVLWCGILVAQSSDWQLRIYGFEEGLSHRNVFRVQQDSSGFLWIATVNGLNRYDGYEFTHYNQQTAPGLLAQDVVADLYCDSENLLWLGHPNYLTHLDRHQTRSDTMVINNQSLARGAEQTPGYIQVDDVGNIWLIAFAEQRSMAFLQCFDPLGELLFEKQLEGKYEKHPMLVYNNVVYVNGAPHEVWTLDLESGAFESFSFPYNSNDADAARVVELQHDKEGNLIVLLANGEVYTKSVIDTRFRQHPITTFLVDTDEFETFYYDEKGNFWLASENGLIFYEEQTNSWWDFHSNIREMTRHDLSYRQIFVDASEVVWVASDFGLIKLVQQNEFFRSYLSGGSSYCSSGFCSMRGITEDPFGNLYFAYYNAIHRLDAGTGALQPLFPDNEYIAAPFGLQWHRGALYTGNGLRIDLSTNAVDTLFESSLEDKGHPVVDETGNLWIAYEQTLYYMSASDSLPIRFVDKQGLLDTFKYEITHLHPGARSGYLWISTSGGGVFRLERTTGLLQQFLSTTDGLQHDRVLATFEDYSGRLWIATASGLHALDLVSNDLKVWDEERGLPNSFVNGLVPEGDSSMWVSTDNGLARLSVATGRWAHFFQEDGLPANEFNRVSFHKANNGQLYFGGLNGVVGFQPDPSYIWDRDRRQSKLLLTDFSKFDGDIDSMISIPVETENPSTIQLSWRDKFFTFRFALADYGNPRENRYSYRLRGFETDWSDPTHEPTARYNNIPAGDYVFEVRAAAGNNAWGGQVLTVPLKIEQPYFKSLWFIGLCGLLLAGIIFAIMRYRIYTIRKREKYLEQQVLVRTEELEDEKQKSEDLLLNILPAKTAEELKANGSAKAQRFESATVMFSDFVGFTNIAEQLPPEELVKEIDYCFRAFDEIMEIYGIEKIKTIGDAYMCAGGLGVTTSETSANVVRAALEMQAFMEAISVERKVEGRPYFEARIGIHTGPVVAGIVGIKKFAYDIWGDTVNIASRLEDNGKPGKVNISLTTYEEVKEAFKCTPRGKISVKNKGDIEMFFVDSLREEDPRPSAAPGGSSPQI